MRPFWAYLVIVFGALAGGCSLLATPFLAALSGGLVEYVNSAVTHRSQEDVMWLAGLVLLVVAIVTWFYTRPGNKP